MGPKKKLARVAYDRDCGLWLSHVQGNSVCCCWKRTILHKRSSELSRSVRCSSGKIGSNRRSRPKKDIVGMFDGLFFVDHNSQTSVLITRFTSAFADSMDDDGHCRRQRATWIRKLGSIARRFKIE